MDMEAVDAGLQSGQFGREDDAIARLADDDAADHPATALFVGQMHGYFMISVDLGCDQRDGQWQQQKKSFHSIPLRYR